jgi:GldM C-terminal domain
MKNIALILGLIISIFPILYAQDAVISVEKFNILYIGLDNAISIAVPNVPSNKLIVTIDNNGAIQKQQDGDYYVRVFRPGETVITVEANGKISQKKFRAKQIPDPIATVSSVPASISRCVQKANLNYFKKSEGIIAQLINFDIDGRCSVQSFEIIISPVKGEIFRKTVTGPIFTEEIKKRFQTLQIGDTVTVLAIKSRCPGDEIARNLNSISYQME